MTPKERLELLQQGYTKDQVLMISEGLEAGLDVSAYRNRDFMAFQMYQIREGLRDHLPVEAYAKPEYDWFQMEEIRLGLKEGLDISQYAKPEVSYEKMRQLRLGLSQGVKLAPYLNLDAGILREVREAKLAKVDISKYVKAHYDAGQLHSIRKALADGIDIDPYLALELRGVAISEIYKGLKSGLDVSSYAKLEYNWQQMREIRLGLENRVDTSLYADPMYSWQQMREIRLGLGLGLPVDTYRNLMYPDFEMKKRRQALMLQILEKEMLEEHNMFSSDETEAARPLGDDIMAVTIAQNGMQAYLTIVAEGKKFTKKELVQFLEEKGVTMGLLEDTLNAIVKGKYGKSTVLVAQGSIPRKGADGWYEFFFRTDVEKRPRVLADGSVDYQNIEWFETVSEGQKIAYYHEAEEGQDGFLVTGERLAARKGAEIKRLTGSGFRVDEDKKTYWSAVDGMIKLRGTRIDITKKLILDEITMATGNMEFDGSILVRGMVGNGTKIKATEDIVIEGPVEAADIVCGGNVILTQGMNAAWKGSIRAAGNIISKYFEAVKVYAGGNIQTNNSLNSELYAEGKVEVLRTIAGGKVESKTEITTFEAGNRAGINTNLAITLSDESKRKKALVEEELKTVTGELATLRNSHVDFQLKFPPEVRNSMDLYLKLEKAIYTKEKEYKELEEKLKKLDDEIERLDLAKIIIKGNAFEGVAVALGGFVWRSTQLHNITVKVRDHKLEILNN